MAVFHPGDVLSTSNKQEVRSTPVEWPAAVRSGRPAAALDLAVLAALGAQLDAGGARL